MNFGWGRSNCEQIQIIPEAKNSLPFPGDFGASDERSTIPKSTIGQAQACRVIADRRNPRLARATPASPHHRRAGQTAARRAAECKILGNDKRISPRRSNVLLGISRSWTALAHQLEMLSMIDKEENK